MGALGSEEKMNDNFEYAILVCKEWGKGDGAEKSSQDKVRKRGEVSQS